MLSPSLQSSSSTVLAPLRFMNLFLQLSPFGSGFTELTSTKPFRKLENLAYLSQTLTFEFLRLLWSVRMLGFVYDLLAKCVLLER